MKKATEPWKRKEPGSRLSDRAAKDQALNTIERAHMEDQTKQKARVHVISYGLKISQNKTFRSFMVYLVKDLSLQEIEIRINHAFGDI